MSDELQDPPEFGQMPDFEPLISQKMYNELKILDERGKEILEPIFRALSVNEQRETHRFNYTKNLYVSIREICEILRKMEREKRNWKARVLRAIIWLISIVIVALSLKYIHP